MRSSRALLGVLLLGVAQFSFAQVTQVGAETVLSTIQAAMQPAVKKLTAQAITWLGVFSSLQFFITAYSQLKSDGDIQSVVAKAVGSVAWVGVCLYLINNAPSFILAVGDQMMNLIGVDLPIVSVVISAVVGIGGAMVVFAIGAGAVSDTAGLVLAILAILVLLSGFSLAFKIFMLQIEVALIALLAPLSFALLGLNTLKDQGIAPFKSLLSLTYRIILMTVILSAFTQVGNALKNTIESVSIVDSFFKGMSDVANALLSAAGAYILLVFLTFKSDAIAASLASGTTSLGVGDVAQAAATGAAIGAAAGTGGTALLGRTPKPMADFMSKMMGGGSIQNASPMGSGGDMATFASQAVNRPSGAATMSLAGSSGTGSPSGAASSGSRSPNAVPGASKANVASGRYGGSAADATQASGAAETDTSQGTATNSATTSPTGTQVSNMSSASATDASRPAPISQLNAAAPSSAAFASGTGFAPSLSVGAPVAGSVTGEASTRSSAPASAVPGKSKPGIATEIDSMTISSASPRAGNRKSGSIPGDSKPSSIPHESPQPMPDSETPTPGSGLGAGIGGRSASLEETLSKLNETMHDLRKQQAPRQPSLGDRVAEANRHVSQERATTQVSINPHHHD